MSPYAQNSGVSRYEVGRFLERCLRDSDAVDLESLCIVAGECVWRIDCETRLLDYHGAALDACVLSCLAALRAFRRPEAVPQMGGPLKIYHSDEREPLPLALHHIPLAVSLGLFRAKAGEAVSKSEDSSVSYSVQLVLDQTESEEAASDGYIAFSVNAHR